MAQARGIVLSIAQQEPAVQRPKKRKIATKSHETRGKETDYQAIHRPVAYWQSKQAELDYKMNLLKAYENIKEQHPQRSSKIIQYFMPELKSAAKALGDEITNNEENDAEDDTDTSAQDSQVII